jgi:hypothetical protein
MEIELWIINNSEGRNKMEENSNMKHVFTMIEKTGEEKARWVKIGIGFVNRDGSTNIYLDALPINGKINVRDPFKNSNGN